jgi:RND family efflux transporter MFP subunit
MSLQKNKAELLNSLAISHEQRQPIKFSRLVRWTMLVILLQAGLISYFIFIQPVNLSSAFETTPDGLPANEIVQYPKKTPTEAIKGELDIGKTKLEAQGFIIASRVATVSSRVLGVVKKIEVEEGDVVQQGQVLAYLDDSHAQVELQLAESSFAAIQARIKSARVQVKEDVLDLKRVQGLFNDNYASQSLFEQKQNELEMSQASVELLMVELNIAQLRVQQQISQLDDHVIRAPFSGVVVATSAQEGEVIAPSGAGGGFTRTGICTIIDMGSLEVVVEINEQLISQINLEQNVEVRTFAYKDVLLSGRVEKVLPRANLAKGTIEVHIELLENDVRILPDMGVRVGFL